MTLTPLEQQHLSDHGWFLRLITPPPPWWSNPVMFAVYVDPSPYLPSDRIGDYTVASVEPVRHEGAWWWRITTKGPTDAE